MQNINSALNPYRTFKAATFFSSSNRNSMIESTTDASSSSDMASLNGPPSPTSISSRSQARHSMYSIPAVRSVRNMMVRSPSAAQLQLLEERITCTDDLLDLVEPRPYDATCDNIEEVLFGRL